MMTRAAIVLVLLCRSQDDLPRRHVEDITVANQEYRIAHGGTMDGVNCRSPIGGGYGIWTQSWESNRSVRMENVGDTDLINPWLSNGRNDFRSIKEIVAGAVKPGMTDRERAIAIWRRQTAHRFHASAGESCEMHDPVKVLNVYGYTTCGDDSVCMAGLWHAAGLPVSPGYLLGHRTSQAYFDGRWNLLDGNQGPIYLLRDNQTIASELDLVRDHDLLKRSHGHGILDRDRHADNEENAALYTYEGESTADGVIVDMVRSSTMDMVLRPGEAVVWRWGRSDPPKYHGIADIQTWGGKAADRICNGLWEFRPDFNREVWRSGAESVENIHLYRGDLVSEAGKIGSIVWRMRSPYVFVGGRLDASGTGVRFSVSWDGATWVPAEENLDPLFPSRGPGRYEYRLKCELPEGARLRRLAILNDVQMAPLALPGMVVGENGFRYTDQSPGSRKVRITHDWVERSLHRPPAAPPGPVSPADGGRTDGTLIAFEWKAPEGAIADYHFELSDRADLAWPLSSNFEKLIRNTADQGNARYRLPQAGLLTPGRTYYWRVRAQSDQGVWGPWSRTWSFTPGGPGVPVEVRLDQTVLRWKGDAVRYRVYGSDERGFSISDEPYEIVVGRSTEMARRRPANFLAETEKTELAVLGPGLLNKAFYRVVAVDERGTRGGPSDPASAPRPYIYSKPSDTAKRGVAYQGQVSTIRSLGDLRLQWVDEREVPSFWDIETPRFSLQQGPSWLKIDERTGALRGVPDGPGTVEVAVSVTLERSVRRLVDAGRKSWNLGWGKDKTLGIVVESAGTALHRFRITVD